MKQEIEPGAASLAPAWATLPLRLFLGVTFIWASLDKLADPAFLQPGVPGYVGQQLAAGAAASPLGGLVTGLIVPNAQLFGGLVMVGELLIGLATLLGWYGRFSAVLGLLINLSFWLTITWDVQPFYFGADLPFAFGWLTLLLAGAGPYSVDAWLRRPRVFAGTPTPVAVPAAGLTRRQMNALLAGGVAAGVIGLLDWTAWPLLHGGQAAVESGSPNSLTGLAVNPPTVPTAQPSATATPGEVPTKTPIPVDSEATPTADGPTSTPEAVADTPTPEAVVPPTDTPQPTATSVPTDTPVPTVAAVQGTLLAQAGELAVDESLPFTDPASGDPGVLIHMAGGYVAYSAICTHEGCTVAYRSSSHLLACPCHGAAFNPASQGAVVRGPARRPLPILPITLDPNGNVYLKS